MPFIKTLCLFILTVFLVLSCKERPERTFNPVAVKSKLAPEQAETIGKALNDYLSMKNALVATDNQQTNENAIAMQNHLKYLQVHPFSELASIDDDLSKIITHNDKSCEPQRIYFKNLSDSLYAFIKNQEITNLHLYRYFCPMALNGKGAWWFSASKKVENPYFGSKMLTCGELVDTIR